MGTLQFIGLAAVTFLSVVCMLIVLHELGHYLVARAFGLKPKSFSVGFGPEIVGTTDRNGTRWKLSSVPLGGYVKFHGEMHPGTGEAADGDHPESFAKLARWKRALVIFAGPFTNLVICAAIFTGLFTYYGQPVASSVINRIAPGSVAAQVGIVPGDRLISYNGIRYDGGQDFFRFAKMSPGKPVSMVLDRGGRVMRKDVIIKPIEMQDRFGNRATVGQVGVAFDQAMKPVSGPVAAAGTAIRETGTLFVLQGKTIWQMIKGERSVSEIAGPVRLAKFSGEAYLDGWVRLIYFAAILSCAVAFTNLLPIPGLDGGYLAMYSIETAMRRNLSRKAFGRAAMVGIGCVIALTLFGLTNDFRVLLLKG